MTASLDDLALALQVPAGQALLVVTGAGVSLASGIPTFRGPDPDAVWANEVTEKGTWRYFARDPVGSWRFYAERFARAAGARPNPAHRALAELERWQLGRGGRFLLVTQNVDGLHRAAGSAELVEVHGRADRARCTARHCAHAAPRGSLELSALWLDAFRAAPGEARLPRCPACGALARPHLLWFDERYDEHRDYQIERVLRFAKRASTVVFAGTSFAVGVTDLVLERALARQAAIFAIDPSGRQPHRRVRVVAERAEVALPALLTRLGLAPAEA